MNATVFATAAEFLHAVGPALAQHEAEHHLVLGVAQAVAAAPVPNGELFALAVTDDRGLVAAAIMTGNRPLLIASDRESLAEAAPIVCDELEKAQRTPTHAIGAVGQVEAVVHEWGRRTRRDPRLTMRQRVYMLSSVHPVPATSGVLRAATFDDLELVSEWIEAFELESKIPAPSTSPRSIAARRIATREVYLWCDPDPRTMAGSARPTRRGIAVNAVYTPPQWRRRGYATACVASLSERLLERYELCVLYTDLANPTLNAIYTRIGYRPVRDFLMYEFR